MKSWAQKVRSGVVGVVFVFYCLRVGGGGGPSDPIRSQFWALRPLAEGGPSGPLGQGAPDILSECPPLMAALPIPSKETKTLEMPGIEPGASHMRSERSTTELHPHRN